MAQFSIGTYVINFGTLGRVVDLHEDGSLLLENQRIGRWLADPQKCERYHLQNTEA